MNERKVKKKQGEYTKKLKEFCHKKGYLQLPKVLIKDEQYKEFDSDTRLVLAFIMERMKISEKNKWFDEEGLYIKIKKETLSKELNLSKAKITKAFKKLKNEGVIKFVLTDRTKIYLTISELNVKPDEITIKDIKTTDDLEEVASDIVQSDLVIVDDSDTGEEIKKKQLDDGSDLRGTQIKWIEDGIEHTGTINKFVDGGVRVYDHSDGYRIIDLDNLDNIDFEVLDDKYPWTITHKTLNFEEIDKENEQ